MTTSIKNIFQNRTQVAKLLADKLHAYKQDSDAIVVAIPKGGVPIGYHLSAMLQLPLELSLCKRLPHPGKADVSIGSVSIDEIIVSDKTLNLPQDYIYYKVTCLQNALKRKYQYYSGREEPQSLKNKVVIVTDDFLKTGNTLLACLKSIQKQEPEKIIVALAMATPDSKHQIEKYADELVVIDTVSDNFTWEDFYEKSTRVNDEDVRDLFLRAKLLSEYQAAHRAH